MAHILTPGRVVIENFTQQGEGINSNKFPTKETLKDVVETLLQDYGIRFNSINVGTTDRGRLDRRPLTSSNVTVTFNPGDTDLVRDMIENELPGEIVEP